MRRELIPKLAIAAEEQFQRRDGLSTAVAIVCNGSEWICP